MTITHNLLHTGCKTMNTEQGAQQKRQGWKCQKNTMKSEHNIKAARCLLSSSETFDCVGSRAALTILWFWRNLLYAVCTSTKDIQSKYENGGSKSTKWKWSKRFPTFYGVNHTLSIWSWLGHFRFATLELLLGFHLPIWTMSKPHFIFFFFKVF